MRCIFCKRDSGAFRSREHILPESLGNTEHILPAGIVCDQCNNYFSREVEKPFLESESIVAIRHHQIIPNKKGKIPPWPYPHYPPHLGMPAILLPRFPVLIDDMMYYTPPKCINIFVSNHAGKQISVPDKGTIVFPSLGKFPEDNVISRFLAKVALEAMASRLIGSPELIEEIVNDSQLDLVRNHARRGENKEWPIHIRQIYDKNKMWADKSDGTEYQIIHEWDILRTSGEEWYLVLAIFGLEFTINYGGPDIDGYKRWLDEHDGVSPLYWGKNAL